MADIMDRPYVREPDDLHHGKIVSTQEARQGVVSGRVRMILRVSLALCVIAFVILLAIRF